MKAGQILCFLGLSFLCLAGCRQTASPAESAQVKTYSLRGKIVATDAKTGALTVDAGPIPGYMDAMTMPYRLADPNTISEMHPGDVITARVLVDRSHPDAPNDPKLDHVVVVAEARPDTKPAVNYHVPAAGDAVPDFKLLNQSGRTIDLHQFRGKVLLVTFIYTRCPQADFCPRMSENFAEIDKALATDPKIYAKTHLLSISFDPTYDTPQVLRSYGGAHTGRFTQEDFRHWDFAAPSVKELPTVEQYFDVGVTGTDPSTLTHSLSTILIGADGKVIAWFPTKDWTTADMVSRIRQAAG